MTSGGARKKRSLPKKKKNRIVMFTIHWIKYTSVNSLLYEWYFRHSCLLAKFQKYAVCHVNTHTTVTGACQ